MRITGPVEQLIAPQDGLCSIELLFMKLHALHLACPRYWCRTKEMREEPEQWHHLLANDQRDVHILFHVFIFIYNSLHVSSTSCSSSGETNCINIASGNSHSMLVAEMCAGLLPTCTHLGHQHRMTVTRGCINKICLS